MSKITFRFQPMEMSGGDTIHQNMASRKLAGVVGETKELDFRPSEFAEWVPKAEMTKRDLEMGVWSSDTQSGGGDTEL